MTWCHLRKISLAFLVSLTSIVAFAQGKKHSQPLIVQGQFANCPEKTLMIWFRNEQGITSVDTITVDESGKFYLETSKITGPQQGNIQQNNVQLNNLFLAPGYNLTITGDARDYATLTKTKKITGIGAESNRYPLLMDSIRIAKNDTTKWYELDEEGILAYIDRNKKLKDSLIHAVFGRKIKNDKYFNYFGRMMTVDHNLEPLYFLLAHAEIHNYDIDRTNKFIKAHFDNTILSDLYREEYMMSPFYTNWIMNNAYLAYLCNIDYQKDSTLKADPLYKLKKVNATYRGPVRDYVLHKLMRSTISNANTSEDLDAYKKEFEGYLANAKSNEYRESIASEFTDREIEIQRTKIGHPAPAFTLKSNTGKTYNLSDFIGKVVYLDLWASWCGPCRAETPSFKDIYEKYKNDERIAFISVAVNDGDKEWRKALNEDKPGWLQLIDQDRTVLNAYATKYIPKFILIDKQGRIADFNAPRPSEKEKLEIALNQEMEK